MVLSMAETSCTKTSQKGTYESHNHYFPPNFKRRKVDVVRDWPRLCRRFTPQTDSNVTGDNIATGTTVNLQALVEGGIVKKATQSSFTSNGNAERCKVLGSYPPRKTWKNCTVVRDFPAGFGSASSSTNNNSTSEKFSAELRPSKIEKCTKLPTAVPKPLKFTATCTKLPRLEMQHSSSINGTLERSSYEESNEIQNDLGGEVGKAKEVTATSSTKSPTQEMQGGSAFNHALEKLSYEKSNEVKNEFGGEVSETSDVAIKCVGNAEDLCVSLGQEIRIGDTVIGALERNACKENGNEVENNFGGVVGKTYGVEVGWIGDAKEISSSLGQKMQGGGALNSALERNAWKATGNVFQQNFTDFDETSSFIVKQPSDAKGMCIHSRPKKNLAEVDRGKSVLRSTGNEIETFSKDETSKRYQANVNRVREALSLFQELMEKLTYEANLTANRHIFGKLPVEAAVILKKQQKWVNTIKIVGHVPGIEVGDRFRYRVELSIVGIHSHFQNGIDCMEKDGKTLAISVVDSGRYSNDKESSDILIYSGQGGNPMVGHKQPEDQKLERGNLALKNSMDAKIPVRVTRGFQATKVSSNGYIYDGLYFVEKFWQEKGRFGKLIFKFQLKRITGQEKPDLRELSGVHNKTIIRDISHERVMNQSKKLKVCRRTLLVDISQGKEEKPINVENSIDDERPPSFTYIARMVYLESSNLSTPTGCDCINGCSDSVKCACVLKNGGEIPFNCNGAIIEAKPFIYECGPFCKCPPSCSNRVSQNGIRLPLEVFKTKSTGWGVRSRNYIPSGSFICEYAGELINDKEAEQRAGNDEYLFDLGNGMHHPESQLCSSNAMDYSQPGCFDAMNDSQPNSSDVKDYGAFAIDAAKYGNVGRFINHSCSPNLYAQNVLYDHDDKRMPHIMLFATKNIPPMRELTYDYNYMVDQVRDSNGQVKHKKCYCGSRECIGRMY